MKYKPTENKQAVEYTPEEYSQREMPGKPEGVGGLIIMDLTRDFSWVWGKSYTLKQSSVYKPMFHPHVNV